MVWAILKRNERCGDGSFPTPSLYCILIHSNYESNMAGLKKNGSELVTLTRPSKTPALQAEKTRMNTTDVLT